MHECFGTTKGGRNACAQPKTKTRLVPADSMGDLAQQVQGVRMIRFDLENLPVEDFRLLQAAGLVMPQTSP